jgi:NitT/TauT family transport system permease protein
MTRGEPETRAIAWPGWLPTAYALSRRVLLPLGLVIIVLGSWELAVRLSHVSTLMIVAPSAIWSTLIDTASVLLPQAMPTLIDTCVGFVLACFIGFLLGTMVVLSHRLHQAIYPHVVLFQLIPKVALAPLFIIWLGVGPSSRLVFALFLAFFPVVIGTSAGLLSADRNAVRLCRSLGASRIQTLFAVQFPYATPHIFAALKMAVTMAMIGVIVGEFITAQQGLGYIIMFASSAGETALVFAAIVLLCVIGIVLYGLVELAELLVTRRLGVTITSSEF